MRALVLVVLSGCLPQAITATCDPEDVDCWADHLTFEDAAGNDTGAVLVDSDTVAALSMQTSTSKSAPVLVSGPPSFTYEFGTVVTGTSVLLVDEINISFTDPNGCSPVLGFRLSSSAGAHSKHTGCFPGVRDMKTSGTITSSIGFSASAAAPTNLNLEVVPISSTDCTSIDNPTALVTSATAVANLFVPIPLTIAPPDNTGSGGSGGDTCPGGLLASTLECDPLGAGGTGSTCISASDYMQATGMPLPGSCTPAGVSGCENSTGTLVHPCCPGLTCEVGAACGDASNAPGGTCH